MRLNFSVPVVALLAGTAIGFCLRGPVRSDGADAPGGDAPEAAKTSLISESGDGERVAVLRERVKELEGLLAEAKEQKPSEERPQPEGGWRNGFRNHLERLERMKVEDPERYAQITNDMARMRSYRIARMRSKLDFLSSIDTSSLGAEAQETHNRLMELMAKSEELAQRLESGSLDDETSQNLMGEKFHADVELHGLYLEERANLFKETVRQLGYENDEANEIVALLSDIIEATDASRFGRHRGGRHGMGGLGGPPPPAGKAR